MSSDGSPSDKRRFPRRDAPLDGIWDGASGLRSVRVTRLESRRLLRRRARAAVLPGEVVYLDRVQGFGVRFSDLALDDGQLLTRGLQLHGLENPGGKL